MDMHIIVIVPPVPRNLSYRGLTDIDDVTFNITLTWSRPDPPNGLIIQYNVSDIFLSIYRYCL